MAEEIRAVEIHSRHLHLQEVVDTDEIGAGELLLDGGGHDDAGGEGGRVHGGDLSLVHWLHFHWLHQLLSLEVVCKVDLDLRLDVADDLVILIEGGEGGVRGGGQVWGGGDTQ